MALHIFPPRGNYLIFYLSKYERPGPGNGVGGVVIHGPPTPYHDAVGNYIAQKTDQRMAEAYSSSGRANAAQTANSTVMVEVNPPRKALLIPIEYA